MAKLIVALAICCLGWNEASPITDVQAPSLPKFLDQPRYSQFKEALNNQQLTYLLTNIAEPITVFAPTDEALSNLKESYSSREVSQERNKKQFTSFFILKRKLLLSDMRNDMLIESVSGEKLRLNLYPRGQTVNGVPFVREQNIENHFLAVYRMNQLPVMFEGRNLMERIRRRHRSNNNQLSTFARCVEAAGLTELLRRSGPFTIFAPNDEAFKALPEAKLNQLLESPTTLKALLMGHVVNGTHFQIGLLHSPDLRTADGGSRMIMSNGTNLEVGGARILKDDSVVAENGVLHVINRVLLL